MSLSWKIAWRYLFAKKKHNAINIVSIVSALGVAVATAAMVCVLSVMNGFSMVVEEMFSLFNPDLRITATTGQSFDGHTAVFDSIAQMSEVSVFSETIEQTALVQFSGRQLTATVKGVDDKFEQLTGIDSIIIDGDYEVYDGAFYRTVMGRGLANQIGIGAHFVSGMRLYAPKRYEKVNMLNPESSLNRESVWISGVFAVNQVEYDDRYMLVDVELARHLFDFAPTEVTAIELGVRDGVKVSEVAKRIEKLLGNDYQVADRYHQQEDFFRIYEIEKLLTILLLAFITLIASLNIIGALSMQMIDKTEDIRIFRTMGLDLQGIKRVFFYEGFLVSMLGALAGVVVGVGVCLIQEFFGIIKLGNGSDYVISAYPVDVQTPDVLLVLLIVLLIGMAAAYVPVRSLRC